MKTVSLPPAHAASDTWHDAEDLRWAVTHWAARIGVRPPQIHLRAMHTKWASMSTAGRLTLNIDLLAVPKPLGEFVIVHELVHQLVPNHGKVFKSFMLAYLPDWQAREQQLRRYDGLPIDPARAGDGPAGAQDRTQQKIKGKSGRWPPDAQSKAS